MIPSRTTLRTAALASLAVTLTACAPTPPAASARAIEGRLLAPCCWTQTLDTHESELATALRDEIRTRVTRGERADAIEDDLAARYGERIRAVPRGRDPRAHVVVLVALAMAAALVLLARTMRRWSTPPTRAHDRTDATLRPRDDTDRRLDDELARLDD